MATPRDSTPAREPELVVAISPPPAFSPPPTVSLRRGSSSPAHESEPPP